MKETQHMFYLEMETIGCKQLSILVGVFPDSKIHETKTKSRIKYDEVKKDFNIKTEFDKSIRDK